MSSQGRMLTLVLFTVLSFVAGIGAVGASDIAGATDVVGVHTGEDDGYELSLRWDFSEGTNGFVSAHGVAPLRIYDGALRMQVTESDPYIHSPSTALIGERDRFARFRLSATEGQQIKVYFTTPRGGWSEARSLTFDIIADGQMREYWVDLSDQATWLGPITQVRLDLEPADTVGAVVDIEQISFFKVGPSLDLVDVRRSLATARPGQPVELSANLSNSGGEVIEGLEWRLATPDHVVVHGPVEGRLAELKLSQTIPLKWTVTSENPDHFSVELSILSETLGEKRFLLPVNISPPYPEAHAIDGGDGARIDEDGHAVIERGGYRIVFPLSPSGYGEGVLYGERGGDWKQLALLPPASIMLEHGDVREHAFLYASSASLLDEDGGVGLVFEGRHLDAVGTSWHFRMTLHDAEFATSRSEWFPAFIPDEAANWFEVAYEVSSDREAHLVLFEGPSLLVGEGSFGATKESALFPGLEWLTGEERSSDTLDAHPPLNLRVAPHPLKVTMPHMAVVADGFLIGLMWDPLQRWAGEHQMPVARFASPNWLHGQDNHFLALSVPSIGAWVAENEHIAHTPYRVSQGEPLRVTAQVAVAQTDDVLTAVDLYFAKYGLTDPGDPPRSWEEQRRLMTHAYMDSYWIPEAQGWGHVHGWVAQPFPGLNETLRMLADRETNPTRREQMLERVKEVGLAGVLAHGSGWLGTSAGGHIALRIYPFFGGFVLPGLDAWRGEVMSSIRGQQDDGHWVFTPGDDPMVQALGTPGERALGLTATPAWDILRFARVTGDPVATKAGLKALDAMRSFRVPRAAQTWEVPVHTPDILAAAKAVGAYVEGYRITGDPAYVADAIYWAKTGLPFVYTWAPDDRPVMTHATIAAFGATHYVLPWFARPVQWNGLVYAYHLMELASIDHNFPWEQVAKGIVLSAMRQQRTEEPAEGGYTDVWELIPNKPIVDVDINPETIAKPAVFVFEGESPDIHTTTTLVRGSTVRINSVAPAKDVQSMDEVLRFRLPYFESATTYALLVGIDRPQEILINGTPIVETSFVERHDQAWTYRVSPTGGDLVIKLKHNGNSQVEIKHRL